MAKRKLWFEYMNWVGVGVVILASIFGCVRAQGDQPLGMTLLFINNGEEFIIVKRFDTNGTRGPVPGGVGSGGGKAQMTFMPSDSRSAAAMVADIEWEESTPVAKAALDRVPKLRSNMSSEELEVHKQQINKACALRHHYTRQIDLASVIPPELVAQVRTNKSTTNLKLVITFNGSDVNIEAMPEKWR